jgi:predicted DNA-binding transcriptional regulator YafY
LLPVLHSAIRARSRVSFDYAGERRTVDPYGVFFRDGNWYVHGLDEKRNEPRTFRIDRIDGELGDVEVGEPAAFDPPSDLDLRQVMPKEPWLLGGSDAFVARVRVDRVQAGKVETEVGAERVVDRHADGSIDVEFPVTNRGAFRSWVLGLLEHAEVLSPPELRLDLVEWLTTMAETA